MIYGNENQRKFLKDWLINESKGAILLYGPEGVGKFSSVQELLLENWEKIIIRSENKILSIETARFLSKIVYRKTTEKRIIIVDDLHKFGETNQNVLLKALEDSPTLTLFVFITHRYNKILKTIKSRSLRLKFNFVSQEETLKFLKEKNFSFSEIDFALTFYPNQPGKAYNLLKNKKLFKNFQEFFFNNNFFEKIKLIKDNFFSKEANSSEINNYFRELIEMFILWERKNIIDKIENKRKIDYYQIQKIRELIELYEDSIYDLRWDLQLSNILLNYG